MQTWPRYCRGRLYRSEWNTRWASQYHWHPPSTAQMPEPNWLIFWWKTAHENSFRGTQAIFFQFCPKSWDMGSYEGFLDSNDWKWTIFSPYLIFISLFGSGLIENNELWNYHLWRSGLSCLLVLQIVHSLPSYPWDPLSCLWGPPSWLWSPTNCLWSSTSCLWDPTGFSAPLATFEALTTASEATSAPFEAIPTL